jgi:hypothetical protein
VVHRMDRGHVVEDRAYIGMVPRVNRIHMVQNLKRSRVLDYIGFMWFRI